MRIEANSALGRDTKVFDPQGVRYKYAYFLDTETKQLGIYVRENDRFKVVNRDVVRTVIDGTGYSYQIGDNERVTL